MAGTGREQLQHLLGHSFESPERLERALTHSSWPSEKSAVSPSSSAHSGPDVSGDLARSSNLDNEKLEFLGDAVLTMIVSEALLESFPDWREGQLSKARASLVNAAALAEAARRIDLGAHLILGKGEEKTGGRQKSAILADAYEAVIAAVYLDGGLTAARTVIERTLLNVAFQKDALSGGHLGGPDSKSMLQELLQARGWPAAKYRVLSESGPDHKKLFNVEAAVTGYVTATGSGFTKKEAEQAAAGKAAAKLLELVESAGQKSGKSNV